jgi:hypothetical protein
MLTISAGVGLVGFLVADALASFGAIPRASTAMSGATAARIFGALALLLANAALLGILRMTMRWSVLSGLAGFLLFITGTLLTREVGISLILQLGVAAFAMFGGFAVALLPWRTTAPFGLHSIHFNFPGGQAIELRDPATDQPVAADPEWIVGIRNETAAYVRGLRPQMRVVFRGTPGTGGTYTIGADGTPFQVEERQVALNFHTVTGLSEPEWFRAKQDLPDQIGMHATKLDWYVRSQPAPVHCLAVGTSNHRVCTTWKAMTPDPSQELRRWVYKPFMEWTCEWAAGRNDEKDICDAIIEGVRASHLRYGHPLRVRDVRHFLLNQGGMCGEWYCVFQQMAHCQGVFVHRRAFLVDWRMEVTGEELWCAIVIRQGGLNQAQPTFPESDFHDNDTGYPIAARVPLVARRERRYQFFGCPGYWDDGHCINFLVHQGRLHLYDACFGRGPIEINSPLPVPDLNVAQGGADLASFKAQYLDDAVDYMLGSLYNGLDFHRCAVPSPGVLGGNGITVRTRDIPDVVHGTEGVTFRWSE